jgi:hypothetical protein
MRLLQMLRHVLREFVQAIRHPVFPDPFKSESLPNYPYAEAVADEARAMQRSSRTLVHTLREDRCDVVHVEHGQCVRQPQHRGQCEFGDGTRETMRHLNSASEAE